MNKSKVYNEVLEILNTIPYVDYLKIPPYYVQYLNNNKYDKYSAKATDISRDAYCLFLKIYLEYIASNEEKNKINEILKINNLKEDNKKKEKYNPEILFNKTGDLNNSMSTSLIIKEDKWYNVLLKKIKSFFIK